MKRIWYSAHIIKIGESIKLPWNAKIVERTFTCDKEIFILVEYTMEVVDEK